jgi:hypothetical protein
LRVGETCQAATNTRDKEGAHVPRDGHASGNP